MVEDLFTALVSAHFYLRYYGYCAIFLNGAGQLRGWTQHATRGEKRRAAGRKERKALMLIKQKHYD